MKQDQRATVEVKILNETDKSYLVTAGTLRRCGEWVPKSLVEIENRDAIQEVYVMHLPEWLAIRAGLV